MPRRSVLLVLLTLVLTFAFGAVSLAPPAAANGGDLHLTVRMLDALTFDPSLISVEPGQSVELTLVNQGALDHTFTLFRERNPTVPLNDNAALQQYNSTAMKVVDVFLAGGQQTVVSFTAPAGEGSYVFVCMVAGHAVGGMHGTLQVAQPGGGLSPALLGAIVGVVVVVVVVAAFFLIRKRGS